MSRKVYRHAHGGLYELIADKAHFSGGGLVVVYRDANGGSVWVRPYAEFHDGRFVELVPVRAEHAEPPTGTT